MGVVLGPYFVDFVPKVKLEAVVDDGAAEGVVDAIRALNGRLVDRDGPHSHQDPLVEDLGLRVVAEGVETEPEAVVLRRCGAHLLQGYYFGRPSLGLPGDLGIVAG